MTTPIHPGDTGALHDAWYSGYESYFENCKVICVTDQAEEAGMQAVARAVCPVGYSVVADDDLRAVLDEFGYDELRYSSDGVSEIIDRLRAAIGGEG